LKFRCTLPTTLTPSMKQAFVFPILPLMGCSSSDAPKTATTPTPLASQVNSPPASSPSEEGAFKLFPTKNIWTQLKLDTRDGRLWQVSISSNGSPSDLPILLAPLTDRPFVGRFTLQPTQNIWTFIMLDTSDGRTWQVQWGANPFVHQMNR
jgi:hypothetical protein